MEKYTTSLLTVIIPVHNSETYLKKCINSILKQTYENLDIILVDNNSTDHSLEICEHLKKYDTRIRLLHQKKIGAAAARNLGLMNAQGDYITFVDSDDYLLPNAYQELMECTIRDDSDIVIGSFCCVDEYENELDWYRPCLKKYADTSPMTGWMACKIFLTTRDIEGFGWNKIFKRKLIDENRFRFEEDKIAYEDMASIFKLLAKSKRVSFVNKELYFYRQHSVSLVHTNYDRRERDFEDSLNQIYECASSLGLGKEAKSSIVYRNILSDYSIGRKRKFFVSKMIKELYKIIRYQRTEKIKTVLKLIKVYVM